MTRLAVLVLLFAGGLAAGCGGKPPVQLTATSTAPWVRLAWRPPATDGGATIDAYVLYRRTGSTGNLYTYRRIGVQTIYTDTLVTRAVMYRYRVAGRNRVGTGVRSNQRAVTVP